jgi:ATP-dependent DNA ligase
MLAKSVSGVPDPAKHGGLSFEPKWDGFRCLVFKDGDEVELASRNTKPLTRYFPEVVEAVRRQLPERIVLDGEIFVGLQGPDGWRLEFETLQERIHPAASRVDKLSVETPAGFVAFDLLALGDESFMDRPLAERRAALVEALGDLDGSGPCFLTRTTEDPAEAGRWFDEFEGAGLDGVVAKPLGSAYEPNKRTMLKIKHERTADVVLAGYREHKTSTPEAPLVGSTTTTASCSTSACRPASPPRAAPSCGTSSSPWSATSPTTRGGGGTSSSPPTPTASPAPRAAGAPARTSGSPPCAPSGCSR